MRGFNWTWVMLSLPERKGSVSGDMVSTRKYQDLTVAILTDTAGAGAPAAELHNHFCALWSHTIGDPPTEGDLLYFLAEMDRMYLRKNKGLETTAVVVVADGPKVFGSSVGDSAALLVRSDGKLLDLTKGQQRKPLIGSGRCKPCNFVAPKIVEGDRLLLCSDGLHRYVKPDQIAKTIGDVRDINRAVQELENLARLPSKTLQDDLSIILLSPEG